MTRYLRHWLSLTLLLLMSISPGALQADPPDIVLNVDPVNGPFYTIQDAIDAVQDNDGYYQINVPAGTYVENPQLEMEWTTANLQARDYDLGETVPNENILRGLQINGDMRPCFPSYQNGYEHAASSVKSFVYSLTTSGGLTVPCLIADSFGTQPTTVFTLPGAQVATPDSTEVIDPTNNFAGGFAIVDRGTIGFATKAFKAQTAVNGGAGAMILVDNSPIGIISMGGDNPAVTIPSWSVSSASGALIKAELSGNPAMTITITPPATFYDPPIGSNFAVVTLDHPDGDFTKIRVTMNNPLPAVDPFLARNVAPVLEDPVFDDPRLALVPGDKIIIAESDIIGAATNGSTELPRTVYTVASLSGNVITLTTQVNPLDTDITKLGSSITFLPNVQIIPAVGKQPVFTAQDGGFSMTGFWIDTSPDIGFAQTSIAMLLSGEKAYLANIIVTDTQYTSANGPAFDFANGSDVSVTDGWRDSSQNRRLASIGWGAGFSIEQSSRMEAGGSVVFATAGDSGSLFSVAGNSSANLGSLICMGTTNLFQSSEAAGVNVANYGGLTTPYLLTVTDIFGSGIAAGSITCDSFRLERIYKPQGGPVETNALQLENGSGFEVIHTSLYADNQQPIYSIRTSSIIRDCFNVDPNAVLTSGTLPNVGIFCDDESVFISHKDLEFTNNDVNMLGVQDNQFITPGWSETPGNIWSYHRSCKLNPNYQQQELRGSDLRLTLDPDEVFQTKGVYNNGYSVGKTFTVTNKKASWQYLKLKEGRFLGTEYTQLRFNPTKGASVTFKVLSSHEVQILSMWNVEYFYK